MNLFYKDSTDYSIILGGGGQGSNWGIVTNKRSTAASDSIKRIEGSFFFFFFGGTSMPVMDRNTEKTETSIPY